MLIVVCPSSFALSKDLCIELRGKTSSRSFMVLPLMTMSKVMVTLDALHLASHSQVE